MQNASDSKVERYMEELCAGYDAKRIVPALHPVWKLHASFPFNNKSMETRKIACAILMNEAAEAGLSPAQTRPFRASIENYPQGPMAHVLEERDQTADAYLQECMRRFVEQKATTVPSL